MRKINDAEKFIRARGWVKYETGQDVSPPIEDDGSIGEWWYHSRHPDGDWYRTARDVFQNVFAPNEPVVLA